VLRGPRRGGGQSMPTSSSGRSIFRWCRGWRHMWTTLSASSLSISSKNDFPVDGDRRESGPAEGGGRPRCHLGTRAFQSRTDNQGSAMPEPNERGLVALARITLSFLIANYNARTNPNSVILSFRRHDSIQGRNTDHTRRYRRDSMVATCPSRRSRLCVHPISIPSR
jgi:hypothetical protein